MDWIIEDIFIIHVTLKVESKGQNLRCL